MRSHGVSGRALWLCLIPLVVSPQLVSCVSAEHPSAEEALASCGGSTAARVVKVCQELQRAVAWCEVQEEGGPPPGIEQMLDCDHPSRSYCEYECVAGSFDTWSCYPGEDRWPYEEFGGCESRCHSLCTSQGLCDEAWYCGDVCDRAPSY